MLNGTLVAHSDWDSKTVNDGDALKVLMAIEGGQLRPTLCPPFYQHRRGIRLSVFYSYALPPLAVSINTRSPASRLIPLAN